jgi:hypothetical protein
LLALIEEERQTCPMCGHPMSECRDPRTAGSWQVISEVCQPGRVAQAMAESTTGRGVFISTMRTGAP